MTGDVREPSDERTRRVKVRYALLTAALFAPLLYSFLAVRNVYPFAASTMMMAGGDLGRGVNYYRLRGETVGGDITMSAFKWLFVAALLAATFGALTNVSTKAAAVLFLFYQGLLRSFTHFNHDEMPAAYILLVLSFAPCGDAFSLDALRGRRRAVPGGSWVYGYPILLARLLLAWSYFTSGLIKLRVAGLGYFSPDNLPALAVSNSLDNMHDTQFRAGLWLPAYREYTPPFVALVVLWELLFPLAVWFPRARVVILTAGALFHLGTLVLMNIFFPYHLAMYLVFVDWPWVVRKLRRVYTQKYSRGGDVARVKSV